jgi:hypothetical protein
MMYLSRRSQLGFALPAGFQETSQLLLAQDRAKLVAGVSTAGTPVPPGFPTTATYTNTADGTLWKYSSATNSWVYAGVSQANAAAATPAASTSSGIFDWLTASMFAGIPNWALAAAAIFAAKSFAGAR